MRKINHGGITFLEVLLALLLVVILAGLFARSGWVQAFQLRRALSEARTLLSLTRTEAVRQEAPTTLRFSESRVEVVWRR